MQRHNGFTLIELSIVLVIIGLIVGGALVGRDLIDAATLRAQISQIEKIQTAVNTFQNKYNCLPGDCAHGSDFGFVAHEYSGTMGCTDTHYANGDGNGFIGVDTNTDGFGGNTPPENLLFWDHLADAGLNVGRPESCENSTALTHYGIPGVMGNSSVLVALYTPLPAGWGSLGGGRTGHYLTLAGPCPAFGANCGNSRVGEILTPAQAFQIDAKVDDGLPGSGNVLASAGGVTLFLNWPLLSGNGGGAPNSCVETPGGAPVYANPSTNPNPRCTLNFASQGW